MRPTDKIIVRIQHAAEKGRGVRLSADDVWVLARGVFAESIIISEGVGDPFKQSLKGQSND